MPKKLVKKDKEPKVKKIVEEIDDEGAEPTEAITELDPEVLEALTAKKVKKAKVNHPVDYIPELERDDFDLGGDA